MCVPETCFSFLFFPSPAHYLWPFRFILRPLGRVPTSNWITMCIKETVSGERWNPQTKFHSPLVAWFMADTLTCHNRSVRLKLMALIMSVPHLDVPSPCPLALWMLTHSPILPEHLHETKPSLIQLVTPVLFLLQRVKMSPLTKDHQLDWHSPLLSTQSFDSKGTNLTGGKFFGNRLKIIIIFFLRKNQLRSN